MNKESESKLREAKNKDEFLAILSEDELRFSEDEIDEMWQRRKALSEAEDLTALEDDELDAVSGGVLGFDDDAEDGHEKTCIYQWHWKNECDRSQEPGGYHYTSIGRGDDYQGYYYCYRCGKHLF